jgi:hypothetical protein
VQDGERKQYHTTENTLQEIRNNHKQINIYELAHKCKEWAKLKYFIDIDSHPGCARWGAEAVSHNGKPSVFYEQVFIGRTEPEAIFKACQWILEQRSNQ